MASDIRRVLIRVRVNGIIMITGIRWINCNKRVFLSDLRALRRLRSGHSLTHLIHPLEIDVEFRVDVSLSERQAFGPDGSPTILITLAAFKPDALCPFICSASTSSPSLAPRASLNLTLHSFLIFLLKVCGHLLRFPCKFLKCSLGFFSNPNNPSLILVLFIVNYGNFCKNSITIC